jgi:hypothetical protein
MGANRSGARRNQRLNRHRKEMNRLIKKAEAAQAAKPPETPKKD